MPENADREGGTPFRKEKAAMQPIFEQLEEATHRLNATGDRATELIRSTNERLQKLGAGVEFWPHDARFKLRIDLTAREEVNEERTATRCEYILGFAKLGSWQLAIRARQYVPDPESPADEVYDGDTGPDTLLSADRELRITAAAMLPAFLTAYAKHLKELADHLPE